MENVLRKICVYCGSSPGTDPAYQKAAEQFGRLLAERGLGLVYGGGRVGLMGIIADAVLAAGGQVEGVIPKALAKKEIAHEGLTRLEVVDSMHSRKMRMAELSDAFVAMPGGIGTFEEILEVMTWTQLGYHAKPCGLLNIGGFYDQLVAFLDHSTAQGFIKPAHRQILSVETTPELLLESLRASRFVRV